MMMRERQESVCSFAKLILLEKRRRRRRRRHQTGSVFFFAAKPPHYLIINSTLTPFLRIAFSRTPLLAGLVPLYQEISALSRGLFAWSAAGPAPLARGAPRGGEEEVVDFFSSMLSRRRSKKNLSSSSLLLSLSDLYHLFPRSLEEI